MGQACTVASTDVLSVGATTAEYSFEKATARFFSFDVDEKLLKGNKDLIVEVQVESGHLQGVYVCKDEKFPAKDRKLWSTERFCKCTAPDCTHTYETCLKTDGQPCATCMDIPPEDSTARLHPVHKIKIGGIPTHAPRDMKMEEKVDPSRLPDEDQTGYRFAVRLSTPTPTSGGDSSTENPLDNLVEGSYFVSVVVGRPDSNQPKSFQSKFKVRLFSVDKPSASMAAVMAPPPPAAAAAAVVVVPAPAPAVAEEPVHVIEVKQDT